VGEKHYSFERDLARIEEGELSAEGESALEQLFSELEQDLQGESEKAVGCGASPPRTISCFPRYQNTVASLPARERAKLKDLAALIVESQKAGAPAINGVRLVGYADEDPQREKREPGYLLRISRERALAVRKGLEQLINDPGITSRIAWEIIGGAADRPIVARAQAELQRQRNRRVEIDFFLDCSRAQSERVNLVMAAAVHFVRTVLHMPEPTPTGVRNCEPAGMPYGCEVTFSNNMTVTVEVRRDQGRAFVSEADGFPNLLGRPVCSFEYRCLPSGRFQFFILECPS
jgi:outer membrane protein OmpA-like peptidoglycan-associated protein